MLRRPPRSTPFPTRRSSDLPPRAVERLLEHARAAGAAPSLTTASNPTRRPRGARPAAPARTPGGRSEEHTSELQSHHELVCRQPLEKKNYTPQQTNQSRRRV